MLRPALVSCCLAVVLVAPPVGSAQVNPPKRPGSQPPVTVVTPTPGRVLAPAPLTLSPCRATGTVTRDAAEMAKHPLVEWYTGAMTFTANVDLKAVTLYTLNYNPGGYSFFLGDCKCSECPKGGTDPLHAPPNSNFKRLESRTYNLYCAWPNGGLPPKGTYEFQVHIRYYANPGGAGWQEKTVKCGELTVVQ